MIPYYTTLAGLVYCAVSIPALLIQLRRKVPTPRAWAFCAVLAVTIAINAIGGQDWLYALVWSLIAGTAIHTWREDVRDAESDRESERI